MLLNSKIETLVALQPNYQIRASLSCFIALPELKNNIKKRKISEYFSLFGSMSILSNLVGFEGK